MDDDTRPWEPEGWDATERRYKLVVSGDSSSSSSSSDEDEDEDEDPLPSRTTSSRPPPRYKKLVKKEAYVPEE